MGTLILIVLIFVLIISFLILIGTSKQNSEFWIEHYPETNRYYPRYFNDYIHEDIHTGLLTKRDFISYALYSRTEEGAKEIIERFKQDALKIGFKRIDL